MGTAPIADAGRQPSLPDDHDDDAERVHDSDDGDKRTDLARAKQVVDAGLGPVEFDASVRDAGAMAVLVDSGDSELQDAGELDASARPREPGAPRGEPMPDASRPDMVPRGPDGGRGGHDGEHERE
jgi:hypothetical protein